MSNHYPRHSIQFGTETSAPNYLRHIREGQGTLPERVMEVVMTGVGRMASLGMRQPQLHQETAGPQPLGHIARNDPELPLNPQSNL